MLSEETIGEHARLLFWSIRQIPSKVFNKCTRPDTTRISKVSGTLQAFRITISPWTPKKTSNRLWPRPASKSVHVVTSWKQSTRTGLSRFEIWTYPDLLVFFFGIHQAKIIEHLRTYCINNLSFARFTVNSSSHRANHATEDHCKMASDVGFFQ